MKTRKRKTCNRPGCTGEARMGQICRHHWREDNGLPIRRKCRLCNGGTFHESNVCSICRRALHSAGLSPNDEHADLEPEAPNIAPPQIRGEALARFIERHPDGTPRELAEAAGYRTVTRLAQVLARAGRADLGRTLLTKEKKQ